ncbi:class I SAM-dependent methyltransferase [Haloarchaeobius amylolyticus]|uniref:Class I SAM-dependent methyltransferase n=1 Tax=Haloarchaeobius amylolyticus TaxID=1198296 RepID=A0ABD6BAU0_9EURY
MRSRRSPPWTRVLDVACGSGTAALVAERRYCDVTALDYVPRLIERAKTRARANGQEIDFQVGEVQFAPDQERVARELLRVCKPGGKIGLAGPIPDGWSGDWFAAHAEYVPPSPDVPSPLHWGTDDGLDQLLGASTRSIESDRRTALQYYRSIDHAVDVFSTYFGPTIQAFKMLDTNSQERLRTDLGQVFDRYNRATDGTAIVENQYLQTVATPV